MKEQSGKKQGIEAGNHSDLLENYEFYFKNSPEAIFLGNPDGTIYKCNPAATTLFGYTEEEFYTLGRDAIFDKNDPFRIQVLNERDKNKEISGIFPHTKKDGTVIYCDVSSKYFTAKDGAARTLTTIKDASKKLDLDESHTYHRLIIDNISDAVYTFDRDITITSWNKSAEKLYGLKSSESIGKNVVELLRSESTPENLKKMFSMLDEKGEIFLEGVHFSKDNKKIDVEAHIISLKNDKGETTGYLTVNRDITMRKEYEKQLQHEKKRLENLADLVGVFAKVTTDYKEALDYTVKKLAEELGDQCVIRLLNEKETQLEETAFWHTDKECMEFITKLYSTTIYQADESFSGETIRNSKPMLIPVVKDKSGMKPEYLEYMDLYGLSSLLFVPIYNGEKILGTISMYRNKPGNPYTIDDQYFLQNVAGKIGFAIFKARALNEKLQETEERLKIEKRYQNIMDNMDEGCAIFDHDWNYVYVNDANARHAHTPKETLLGKNLLEIIPGVEKSKFFETYQRCMRERIPLKIESEFKFADGKSNWYEVRCLPVPEGIFILSIDITERMKTEDALRENEERFRTLADNILQLTWMTDENGYIFWYNKRWYDYTGTTLEEMQGWGWEKVHHPDHIDRVMKIWTGALKEGKPWEDIFPLRSKEGEYGWFLSRAMPICDGNGKILRWFGTNTDITERMKAEDALKEAYKNIEDRFKEKEVLLRELYHRTKNNMQVVYSLLGLKGAAVEDMTTKDILMDVGNRIQAIALVHEKLYQSKNLSRIDLKDYITDLASLLVGSYNSVERKIELSLDLGSINVLIDTAIPCGQIIIELISNSFKHAFPDGRSGKIFIHLSRNETDLIKLSISDNGIGLADNSNIIGEGTLGMQLFRNIVEDQLQGDISYNMENGLSWTVSFKDILYKERI